MRNLLLAFLATVVSCVAQQPKPAVTLPDWVTIEANIPYAPHPETVLDVIKPKAATKGKRPGLLAIHGGGWRGGTKEASFQRLCLPFLEKGFVVANVEYRLADVAPAPAAVTDVLMAAAWFHRNAKRYGVDSKRIAVIGTSAGAHLALMVGMTPKSAKLGPTGNVAAVINFYGITDVADQLSGPNMRQYAVAWVPDQPGRLELARRVSPMTYVRKKVPPIITVHGDADDTVPYDHGANLTKALRRAGADALMIPVPQGKHGFTKEQWETVWPRVFAFLEQRGIIR
ncbi:MAG: alpha/beta hydrolase [Bryobacteraceae bacterium]